MKEESKTAEELESSSSEDGKPSTESVRQSRRKISGDLAYNSTPGGLERTLKAIITAQKPSKVDIKYIQTTLAVKGGTGSNQAATLKKLGIISDSGAPTEIYDEFRNDKLRSHAAFQMLQNGYGAIFKVNAHAHKATDDELKNIIAQVTGLDKEDTLISTIFSCFDKVKAFINPAVNVYEPPKPSQEDDVKLDPAGANKPPVDPVRNANNLVNSIGLNYQINLVLPQSGNIETYNMIFKSLRDNLLDWNK